MKRRPLIALLLAAPLLMLQAPLGAQVFPDKPIRVITGFAPGGSIETLARLVGQPLGARLGVPVVIEARAGAGGTIAAAAVAKAPKDGYTILFSADSLFIAPLLRKDLPYDPVADFLPLANLLNATLLVAVHPKVAARTLEELIALAKARPGSLRYASSGSGTVHNFVFEMLKHQTGANIPAVQYKGNAPAAAAVVAGEPEVLITGIPDSQSFLASGQLRPLAVIGQRRIAAFPALPSTAESGLVDIPVVAWLGFFAPSGVPPAVANRLGEEIAFAAASPEFRQRLVPFGMESNILKGDAFAAYLKTLAARYRDLVAAGVVTAEN